MPLVSAHLTRSVTILANDVGDLGIEVDRWDPFSNYPNCFYLDRQEEELMLNGWGWSWLLLGLVVGAMSAACAREQTEEQANPPAGESEALDERTLVADAFRQMCGNVLDSMTDDEGAVLRRIVRVHDLTKAQRLRIKHRFALRYAEQLPVSSWPTDLAEASIEHRAASVIGLAAIPSSYAA